MDTSRSCAEFRGHHRVPGTAFLTAWADSEKSGRAWRGQALRFIAIRQARLKPLASGTAGQERTANG